MDIVEYLKKKGIKVEQSRDIIKLRCFLPGHDHETVPSFAIYPDTDSFYCFGCKRGGDLKRLMTIMGDPVPTELLDMTPSLVLNIKINPKRPLSYRVIRCINRIRRLRPGYKNQTKLDRIVTALVNLEEPQEIKN